MPTARAATLADIALPRSGAVSEIALIAGAAAVTAASAQVAIPLPWSPVPITLQTLAVLLSGAVLGPRRAILSQSLYLGAGAVGLPVFAGAAAGAAKLIGPTGGYLLAFPFAAAITGWLATHGWQRRFGTMLAALLLGSAVIFAAGLAGLSRFVPANHLLAAGLWPFLLGDLVKASIAALVFPAVWRRVPPEETPRA